MFHKWRRVLWENRSSPEILFYMKFLLISGVLVQEKHLICKWIFAFDFELFPLSLLQRPQNSVSRKDPKRNDKIAKKEELYTNLSNLISLQVLFAQFCYLFRLFISLVFLYYVFCIHYIIKSIFRCFLMDWSLISSKWEFMKSIIVL